MPLTRRQFTAVAAAGVSLVVLGPTACGNDAQPQAGDPDKEKNKAHLATAPFLIGPAAKYKSPGIYDAFKKDTGVWIVSDGNSLVALSATCTHQGCTTHWLADDKNFQCPCHKSRFDSQGLNVSGKAKRPLERCALKRVKDDSGELQVQVDPTRRFRKDKDEWSNPDASLPLNA